MRIPTEPAAVVPFVTLLGVRADEVSLTPEQFTSLCDRIPHASGGHARVRRAVVFGGQEAALIGSIGVHEDEAQDSRWLHYAAHLVTPSPIEEEIDEHWQDGINALAVIVGEHEYRLEARLTVPADAASLAVALPIAFSETEVPGFSAIRGVELVKYRDAQPETVEYHVILQRFPDVTTASVFASELGSVSEHMLVDGLPRLLEIGRFAMPSLPST